MSARSASEKIFSLNGGMARLLERTKPENASQGSGSGASRLPPLVAIEPCPNVP